MVQFINQAKSGIEFPKCQYDRVVVLMGELKQQDELIAAGLMMTKGSPAWAVIFLANHNGQRRIYTYDPGTARIQEILIRAGVELIIF